MAAQNLPMSDEMTTIAGRFESTIFLLFYINDYTILQRNQNLPFAIKTDDNFLVRALSGCAFVSDQLFVLSDKNDDLVGHMSLQEKETICNLGSVACNYKL